MELVAVVKLNLVHITDKNSNRAYLDSIFGQEYLIRVLKILISTRPRPKLHRLRSRPRPALSRPRPRHRLARPRPSSQNRVSEVSRQDLDSMGQGLNIPVLREI